MIDENEELAIISGAKFGVNDRGWVGLSFRVRALVYGSGQFLIADDAVKLLKKHSIFDVNHLNGKPCVVVNKGTTMMFKDLV